MKTEEFQIGRISSCSAKPTNILFEPGEEPAVLNLMVTMNSQQHKNVSFCVDAKMAAKLTKIFIKQFNLKINVNP
jgi:hypothetical protein